MPRTPPRPPKGTRFGGRTRGTPNRATANAREAIARFVDANSERFQGWLDEVAKQDGPKAAFACVVDLLEFSRPQTGAHRDYRQGRQGSAA